MRPKGSKDKQKRNSLTWKQENEIINLRKSGYTKVNIALQLDITEAVVRRVLSEARRCKRIKPFFYTDNTFQTVDIQRNRYDVGVYVIAMHSKVKNKIHKGLIGSSRSIGNRIGSHLRLLNTNRHCNTDLQLDFNSNDYILIPSILLKGDLLHGEELSLEAEYINKFEPISLYNTWSPPTQNDIKPFLDKRRHYINENNYTVMENGCWNWYISDREGYGKSIKCQINNIIKCIRPHRLSYYNTYGEYPELIRHICNNKLCVNPEHLKMGSHQQNRLDKSEDFLKEFEKWWLHYKGNVKDLTDHFGFKPNYNNNTSNQIYYWEKKLGLRNKYPEVYEWQANRIRR